MNFNRTTIRLLSMIYEYPGQSNTWYADHMSYTLVGLSHHFRILESHGIIKKIVRREVGRPNAWFVA